MNLKKCLVIGKRSGKLAFFVAAMMIVGMIGVGPFTASAHGRSGSNDEPALTSDDAKHPVGNGSPTSLNYTILFAEPRLQAIALFGESFTTVNLQGGVGIGQSEGAPTLPVNLIKLLLPAKTKVTDIEVTGEPVEVTMPIDLKENPIIPYQNPVPIGDPKPKEIAIRTDIYDSNDPTPGILYDNQKVGYCRGYAILSLSLHPVQYIPAEGKLSYYPNLMINVELEENGQVDPFYRNNLNDEEWVQSLVYNPEMTKSYQSCNLPTTDYPGGICDPSDDYDYVIITTTYNGLDHWVTTSSIPYNWTSLMDKHAADDGLSCTLVTMEDIDVCSDYWNTDPLFNDTPAHIREFCKDAYQDWDTEYIFIGGDDEWIPAREMDYDYESNVDSDLYWSNLNKTFNADHDNDWGEEGDGGFDLYSELYIGRITCDEPQDVSNWMKKSFYYADSTFRDYLENAAFYGDWLSSWSVTGHEFIMFSALKGTSDFLGPNPHSDGPYPTWLGFLYGFETWNVLNPGMEYNLSVKVTADGNNSNPPPAGWEGYCGADNCRATAVAIMKNHINNDSCTLISAIAHANEHMCMGVYDTEWESDYHNTKPFFVHDYGCHCGDMDAADDGVLHSMLFHSDTELAFACVYHTGYGWGNFDSTNSSSAVQQKLFWDYMFDTANNSGSTMNWQLGKAHAFSKDAMAPTIDWTTTGAPGSWRCTIESCLLFGDPAQRIKPPIQPEHNIGIQEFDVSSHEPADTDIWVNATLYNNGKHNETNVEVRFLVNGVEENSTNISFFEKGTLEEVGWLYHTPTSGWETLCVNVTMVPGENISIDNEVCRDVIYGPDIAVAQIQAPDYLGQGFAKPVKGYVQNLGPTDENVTINFIANNTLINTTNINLTSGSSGWVTFMWDATTSGLGTYNVTIHAVPVANEYYLQNQNKSHEVNVFQAIGNVLLVDDDKGDSYEWWYENALLMSNFVYDIYNRYTQPAPSPSLMQGYTAVVWFTGDDSSTTLQSDDKTNLATYLDNGGKLFVSGQDIGYDIRNDADGFYSNYLHANYLVDTAGWDVTGETGDPIGDGLAFGISSGDGANNQDWPDGIAPIGNATSCFYYSDATPNKAGIKVSEGAYRIVYFGFGFEAIDNMADRTTVMTRILAWLAAEHDIGVTNLDVLTYIPYNVTTYVKATIINGGINDESNIVVNFTVNGTIINSTTIPTLNAGQSQLVSFAWNPAIGVYLVGIEAQPVPGENITSNNALYKTVHVIPAPDIWVDPTEFNFYLNEGVTVVDTLIIGNEPSAEGNLTFNISLSGSGAGEYSQTWHTNYPGEEDIIEAMYFGDADNDGDMEMLVGTDDVHVIGYSGGSYYEESVITQTDGQLSSAIIADMDDDGENEVKACDIITGPGKEWIVEWNGSAWVEQWSYTYGGNGHSQFAQPVGDIDEDGKNETLVGGYASDTTIILSYNQTTGNYEQEYEWTEGAGTPSGVCVVDLDGNGDLEFAVSWVYGSANGVYAYDWDGTTLTELDSYSGIGFDFAFDVYACDYDEDGDIEVLIANDPPSSSGYHVTALGWSSGSFIHEASWGSGEYTENPMIWSGDTDGDGHTEVIACASYDKVHALNWDGTQWNADVVASGLPSHPYGVVCGDIDGDGIDEIGIGLDSTDVYVYDWIPGWLSVDPTSGLVEVGDSLNVSVIVNSSGLAEGDYHSTIIVTSNDLDEPTLYIPVNLTVVFEDDVGVISVNYPTGVIPPDSYTVNATIENFGSMNQTDVLVNCSIYEGVPGGVCLEEDFEGTFPPAGWTVVVNGDAGGEWKRNDAWGRPNYAGGSGYCADADSDAFGSGTYMDTELWTPSFSLADCTSAELSFIAAYNDIGSGGDYAEVDISIDGGSNWVNLLHWDEDHDDHGPGENVTINLSSYTGNSNVIIRWHYGDATYDWWWEIDNVTVNTGTSIGNLVYSAEATIPFIATQTTEYIEFTPPWNALAGSHIIKVKTMLPGDQDPSNDQATGSATIIAANDTGVVSINRPTGLQRPGDYAVNATVRNFGSTNQTSVPVNCSIYNESDVMVYSADTTVNVDALNSVFVEFSPSWTVTDEGDYLINVTTLLAGDAQPNNDANETVVTIQAYTDVGVTAINRPTGVVPPSDYVVNATVENFGGLDKMVPVNCSIYEGVSYSEDFEADNGGYTHAVGPGPGYNDDWEWGTPTSGPGSAHSGVNVWATNLAGDFQNYGDMVLDSVSIDLSAIASPQLTFWHWYDFSGGAWDGGNVKISTDGGSTWNLIYPDGGYPGTASSGNQGIPNEECYTNDMTSSWEQTTFDLDTYSGETAIIRWHCGTTTVTTHPGWYIDDVNVSSAGSFAAGDLVYSSETTVFVEALNTSFVEFTPPWNATLGNYTIKVTAMLPGDENADNDQTGRSVEIKSPTIDYITITETEGGTEIADQTISLGWNKTGYASAYNNTCGYIGLVSVNWSVVNVDGANATTFPSTGNWSTFNAEKSIGNATWKADDGNGHNDTVIFEITGISVDIPLYSGWNLITIPVENDYTAKSLIENISGCQIVCGWDSIDQEYECFTIHSPDSYDFPIENGMGYFVGVTKESNFSVTGKPISNVSIDLHPSWNLIGWFNENSTTAKSLMENITSCEIVCRWDSIDREYDCFTSGSPPEYSFAIEIGMGLFVGVTQESVWHGEG